MNEKEIIIQIQKGKIELFNRLILMYQKDVFKMILSIIRNIDDAEDLAQEAFVKAFMNIKKFKFLSSFKTWLISIAMNLTKTYLKKKKHTFEYNDSILNNWQVSAGQNIQKDLAAELMEKINKEISALSAMQKLVFILRIQQGKAIAEIAEYLNIKQGTVKSHLNRIFTKLRKKYLKQFNFIFRESD